MQAHYRGIVGRSLPYGLAFLGIMLVLTAWYPIELDEFYNAIRLDTHLNSRLQLVIGLGFLASSVWWFAKQKPLSTSPKSFIIPFYQESIPLYKTYWVLSVVGLVIIVFLAFWNTPDYRVFGWRPNVHGHLNNYIQLAMFLGGSCLWVVGFMTPQDPRRIWNRITQSTKEYPMEWVLVLVLTIMALAVRLYRLDSAIPLMVSDESAYLVAARRVMDGFTVTISNDMHFGDLYLGAYIISLLFKVTDPSLFTGRLLVAIVGALAIPGVYLMARRFFGWKAAWLAALFLVTQPVHVHFSRIAIYNMYDLTFGVLAVLLMWDGFERGGRWKFAFAGALLGISQYYYAGSLIWFVLIPLWLLVEFLRHPRPVFSHWSSILLMVVSALVVQYPMYTFFTTYDLSILQHSANMSEGQGDLGGILDQPLQHYFENLSKAVRAYVDLGDTTRHYGPGGQTAINLRWALLLFALGLAVASRYALHPGILFLLMWMGIMLVLGGALMRETPGFSRYTTITVPMSILAGVGLWWFLERLREVLSPRRGVQVFALGLGVMFIVNVQDFHLIQGRHNTYWLENSNPNRFVSYAVAVDAVRVVKEGHTPLFIFRADDDRYTDRYRLLETYQYLCGMSCPYDEVIVQNPEEDLSPEWLASLQQQNEAHYIYILPVTATAFDPEAPPNPNSPADLILEAYPAADFERVNNSEYDSRRDFALYTLVTIPAGAAYSPSGQLIQMGGGG